MKRGAAAVVVAMALALPAFGQHGGGHAGSGGHGGFAGHSGFSGHAGFVGHGSSGFAGRAGFAGHSGFMPRSSPGYRSPGYRYGGFARPGFARPGFAGSRMPLRSGYRVPYNGYRNGQHRPPYRPVYGDHGRGWDRDHDRDRRHGGWYAGFGYGYPGYAYYPYPFVIDPGFYDWGDSGNYGEDQGEYSQGSGTPDYAPYADNEAPPYPDYGEQSAPGPYNTPPPYRQQPSYEEPASPITTPGYAGTASPASEEQLTVVFKNGRAPQKMQNYMLSARSLTDLDPQHYEKIPLDQIDVAATEQVNRTRGVEFAVPRSNAE